MFKSPTELKEFIIWAKSNGLKTVKVGEIQFEVSDIAIINAYEQGLQNSTFEPKPKEELDSTKTLLETAETESEDDLLYYSAQ